MLRGIIRIGRLSIESPEIYEGIAIRIALSEQLYKLLPTESICHAFGYLMRGVVEKA